LTHRLNALNAAYISPKLEIEGIERVDGRDLGTGFYEISCTPHNSLTGVFAKEVSVPDWH
jgi:hypothetical protein